MSGAAFFLAHEYLRAEGLPGLITGLTHDEAIAVAERYIATAAGQLGIAELAHEKDAS